MTEEEIKIRVVNNGYVVEPIFYGAREIRSGRREAAFESMASLQKALPGLMGVPYSKRSRDED